MIISNSFLNQLYVNFTRSSSDENVSLPSLLLSFRPGHQADAELWEEHLQEDQHRPPDEHPRSLCER